MALFDEMMKKASSADGFLAALDQSGGSTPKALKSYGVPDDVRILSIFGCLQKLNRIEIEIESYPLHCFCPPYRHNLY